MTERTRISDGLSNIGPSWWSRNGIGKNRVKGIRINEGRGFAFVTDDEILPLANALAGYLSNKTNN